MKRALLLALLAIVAGCADDASSEDDAASDESQLVGGEVTSGDPAVVAINIKSTGFTVCTGTLIAPRVVLTAGHCPLSGIWVRRGSDVRGLGLFSHIGVKSTAKHPKFTGEGKPYDVALLELDDDLDDVEAVPLSDASLPSSDVGTDIRHVGYGTTGDDLHFVGQIGTGGVKREATYPITKIDDFFVFSGGPGKQTCLFDSGGPAFQEKNGQERLIAVVSNGPDCHSEGWDTRVDRPDVLSWIDQQLEAWGTKR